MNQCPKAVTSHHTGYASLNGSWVMPLFRWWWPPVHFTRETSAATYSWSGMVMNSTVVLNSRC